MGVTVANLAHEAFNDALFFREQASKTDNLFEKDKYKRASLVFFCISAEAMINKLIACNLEHEKKKRTLSNKEEEVLKFLTDESDDGFCKGFSNVRKRLNKFLLKSIGMPEITDYTRSYDEFKKYVELSEKRNAVAHYSPKKFKEVYFDIDQWINEAPDIIENLFNKYYDLIKGTDYLPYACNKQCSKDEFLTWYKEREWKEIE